MINVSFQKCLTTLDLTSLGVGSCCGTGMYLVAGMVAKTIAGPGVILSFFIAAIASIFSGMYRITVDKLAMLCIYTCKHLFHTRVSDN